MKTKLKLLTVIVPIIFILDQITKQMIVRYVSLGSSIPVFPGLFDLVHTRNKGAAFGIFSTLPDSIRVPLFFVVSTVALLMVTLYFFKLKEDRSGIFIALACILGGACGNIWDRIVLGEVVDFLSFHWYDKIVYWELGGYWVRFRLEWPAFNVADMAISISVIWLTIKMLRPEKR